MNKYGTVIEHLRKQNNLSLEELANILLITPDKMLNVEQGMEKLTDGEIMLCANVLSASSSALKRGEYRPRSTEAELEESLKKFNELYKAAAKSEAAILDMLQEFSHSERYKAMYIDEPEKITTVGFAIYDSISLDYVKDEKGQPLMYPTAFEAFSVVKELEEKYQEEKMTETKKSDVEIDEPEEPEWQIYNLRI